jgi:hypothetical protein
MMFFPGMIYADLRQTGIKSGDSKNNRVGFWRNRAGRPNREGKRRLEWGRIDLASLPTP